MVQRIIELLISKRNEKWLIEKGAKEYGADHYKWIVIMHVMFFVSMFTEYNLKESHFEFNIINYFFLVIFVILQICRVWILVTLGKYWNTKILRIPGTALVASGPYKYLKHPNYLIVCLELFSLPMIFDLYLTAIIFTILNAIVLTVRIREENKVLV